MLSPILKGCANSMKINEFINDDEVTVYVTNDNKESLSLVTKVIGEFSKEDSDFLLKIKKKLQEKHRNLEFCVIEPFMQDETVVNFMYARDEETNEIRKQHVHCRATMVHDKRRTYIYERVDIIHIKLPDRKDVHLIASCNNVEPTNRRAEYRLSMTNEVDMRINSQGGIKVVKLKDLSISGVGLFTESETNVHPGDLITIDFYDVVIDKTKRKIETHYRLEFTVVRTVKINDEIKLVGGKTHKEPQKQIMSKFINRKQLERSRR